MNIRTQNKTATIPARIIRMPDPWQATLRESLSRCVGFAQNRLDARANCANPDQLEPIGHQSHPWKTSSAKPTLACYSSGPVQKGALRGTLGNGIASRMFSMPVM